MEQMEYIKIPLSGVRGKGKFVLVDGDYDGEYFRQYKWYLLKNGYVGRVTYKDDNPANKSHTYLHQEVCRPRKGYWVDHIDRDKLNNRSCNLRLVTPSESALNRTISGGQINKHGYRGVRFIRKDNRWRTVVAKKYIGQYTTKEQAALAYNKVALIKWGDMAVLNEL